MTTIYMRRQSSQTVQSLYGHYWLSQVGRKSLDSTAAGENFTPQIHPENITPALKKQCFQGYWCLSTVNKALMGNLKKSLKKYSNAVENLLNTGYLGGSLLNPCLPIIYKGIVSPALGNIKNHNLSNFFFVCFFNFN